MELFWLILASVGAGVGTGLAGLSAATVMVPILLVLCPSFAGENGAYHATTIALASDILGSAVTTAVYIRHKNIDLRRGWIMLVCILFMCIAGSYAAFRAGRVVLGGFSLFLTFFIGIRFLVKPDTQKKDTLSHGARLGLRGVLISLFFGLTIGFGTGFVGTGGGMMMLVVFTAFLGMDRKTAVGTSTFIMTFTALIASVSHMLIDTTILLEQSGTLILCAAVTTAASLLSAQFANRVSGRTVGLVTGAVLTLLGGFLLLLHYKQTVFPVMMDMLLCFRAYLLFLAVCLAALLPVHFVFHVSRELWRKLLHVVAYSSSLFMMLVSGDWLVAALCCLLFAAVVYPILALCESVKGYDDLFFQRHSGEIKRSLLLLFGSHAALIAVFWGLLGRPYVVAASILMWGISDAAAALIGKRFGRHKLRLPLADPNKSVEGSAAMALSTFLVGTVTLALLSPYPLPHCMLFAAAAAPVSAYTEMISRDGNDTVTVALACAIVLTLLMSLVPLPAVALIP